MSTRDDADLHVIGFRSSGELARWRAEQGAAAGRLVALPKPRPLPDDTPDMLRALAERVERSEIESLVIGMCLAGDGAFEWLFPSSRIDSLTLSTLLHATCIDRMRK